MSKHRKLRRLPRALAVGLFLCLLPTSAFATPVQAPSPAPGISAPSPLSQEVSPTQSYLRAAEQLTALGLDQGQIDVLWARLGPTLSQQLDTQALSAQALAYLAVPYGREENLERYAHYAKANPQMDREDLVANVNMGLDGAFYEDVFAVENSSDPLVLVNKYHMLPSKFVPELEALGRGYGSGSLAPSAAAAFRQMADAARLDGISLSSVSAYRSYSTQSSLYRRYVSQSGQRLTDTFSARAGYSEHQTGLALDINVARTSAHFENTAAFAWLEQNCADYGFILRYPKGKEAITGFRFEPWHYRYVGIDVAQQCTDQGLTFEEYMARQRAPYSNQTPTLTYQGQTLELGHGALMLDGAPYYSVQQLGVALGWQVDSSLNEGVYLYNSQRRLLLFPGRYYQADGIPHRLTGPAVELDGALYLTLSDLCSAMQLERHMVQGEVALKQSPITPATNV